jgi:uncharacterized protein
VTTHDITKFARLSWNSPKTERRSTGNYGDGVFASEPINKGELLAVWGGAIVSTEELHKLPQSVQDRCIQVEIDHHLCSGLVDDAADCFNHSCSPNAGLQGQITLVAMRDIAPGEHICFDYAMSDAHPEFYLDCQCGSPNCRHRVTGNDWKLPELQARYDGYFSPYIQRQIEAMKRGTPK